MSIACVLSVLAALTTGPQGRDTLAVDQLSGVLGARLDSQLARFADYGFSGTVLVVREGRIVLLRGYGLADAERRVPNRAGTRFEMNSMTKMFTGAAILQLAAEGRLRLDDPVARHLAGFTREKERATIEHLATHTSGLIVRGAQLDGTSREAFVRDVATSTPESAPGERYRYSNAGFSLLAAIIETASGESYEAYLRRQLFEPAGMRSAGFRNEVSAADTQCAHGYVGTPAGPVPGPPNPYEWGTIGAGGVWSTVGDMYRWLMAVEGGRILPEAQLRLLLAPPRAPAEEAFGWRVHTAPDGRDRIDKGGGSDDFASQLLYYPRERVVVIWASNDLRQRWRRALNQVLPGIVFGGAPLQLPPVATLPGATLDRRAGRYIAGRDTLDLIAGAGCLHATANRLAVPTDFMFLPQGPEEFTAFDPATRSITYLTFAGVDGSSLTLTHPDGTRWSARRSSSRKEER